MATADFTYACGHAGSIGAGNRRQADYRAAQLGKEMCLACRRDAEAKTAMEAAETAGMATLIGTPKQVAYAETIRGRFMPQINAALDQVRGWARTRPEHEQAELLAGVAALDDILRSVTSVKYWLDEIQDEKGYASWESWVKDQLRFRNLAPTALPQEG